MAAKEESTRIRIENLKSDIRSISTCTADTVASLQNLLADACEQVAQKENTRIKGSQLHGVQSKVRRGAAITRTTSSTTETTNISQQSRPFISSKERYILATEVANTTLKSLTDALRTQPASQLDRIHPKPKSPVKDVNEARKSKNARTAHAKIQSRSQEPLRERCASQVANPPTKPSQLRRSLSYPSYLTAGHDPGLVATAECCRAAFAYLRSPPALKTAGKDSPALQLENGNLVLIGKLIAHNLDNLAIKELRILKRKLEKFVELGKDSCRDQTASRRSGLKSSVPAEKESIAALLDFGDFDLRNPALPIVANHQLYTLRVIAMTKRSRTIEAAWEHLKLSIPSSPANLLWRAAESSEGHPKALQQLESLAQILLSFCPSISIASDATNKNNLQLSPDVAFSLQHLAFKTRQRWWRLAKHQGDEHKELLEPFTKCLAAFARRSERPPIEKYKLAEVLWRDLLGEDDKVVTHGQSISVVQLAARCLSSLAQNAGLGDEALNWLSISGSKDLQADLFLDKSIRLVRTATLALESFLKGTLEPSLQDILTGATEALSGSLSGSPSELDSLFMEVNALRRVASKTLLISQSPAGGNPISSSLRHQALHVVTATIHFVARFVGPRPPENTDSKVHVRYNERLWKTAKCLKSIIDSTSICSKQPFDSDSITQWKNLDYLLQDCVRILRGFSEDSKTDQNPTCLPDDVRLPFVKLSNLYWNAYLQLREIDSVSDSFMMAMKRSVKVLQGRPRAERQSGLLAMKLEKLGEALDVKDAIEGSRDAFRNCIWDIIDNGGLQEVTELGAQYTIQQIFDGKNPTAILGRVLKSYQRSFLKDTKITPNEGTFFDDVNLPPTFRGLLLEWQLTLFLRTFSKNRPWNPALNSSIQTMIQRLLDLYVPTQFPVRRRRADLLLIQLSQSHPNVLCSIVHNVDPDLNHEVNLADTQDKGLLRYESHLTTLVHLKSELRRQSPSLEKIRACLTTWQSMVDSVSSWANLLDQVDDLEYWLQELRLVADFLAAKGEEYIGISVLHLIAKILELERCVDPSRLVIVLSTLALQYLRLGYSGKAGLALAKAEPLASRNTITTEAKLQWHLSYAEYLVKIGNTRKCETTLAAAESISREDSEFMNLAKSSATLSSRVRFNRILADACYVYSLWSLANGYHKDAARYAKQSVSLNRRVWAALESKTAAKKTIHNENNDTNKEVPNKGAFDPPSSMRNEKGAPLVMSITHASLDGPEFWSLVPHLYRAIMQHSFTFAYQGLLHEAVFVAEQAEKIASATQSRSLTIDNSSQRAAFWAQSGRLDKADLLIASIDTTVPYAHLAMVSYYSSIALVQNANGKFDEELATYEHLENLLKSLTSASFILSMDMVSPSIESLASQMSGLNLEKPVAKERKQLKGTRGRKPAIKAAPKTLVKLAIPATTQSSSIAEECAHLEGVQADITLRKALSFLLQDDIAKALESLDHAKSFEKAPEKSFMHLWTASKIILSQSTKELAKDFTFNTLPESTIAFPAICLKERKSSSGPSAKRVATKALSGPSKVARGKKLVKESFASSLREARDRLIEAHTLCLQSSSNHAFQQASYALGQVTVLLSAVSAGDLRGSLHPLYAAFMGEIPKCYSLNLAQASIETDQETRSREEALKWPELYPHNKITLPSAADFQKDYIDIIPESWTAVSLSLNESQDEIYVTRYEASCSPFVLRLPMARHVSRDMDEEEFCFKDGRRDFEEIIELSDFSTRSAKDMTSKEARSQWWAERDALDEKLHSLLLNIENIWFGGFKGIFSQHLHQPALLARFRKSFENILNRHLPSRRGKSQQKRHILDSRILELFVGLGDATKEEADLDDGLLDLLYFVVDILQFNGERNAYDEIDFDNIVIETLDALRAYHSASWNDTREEKKHVILILDKHLHMFPWESLPFLQSLSISRLPSLATLRERILAARSSDVAKNSQPGHYIRADAGGTSILNPSRDLTHTLKAIQPRLDDVKGDWDQIINRAPSEKEFESALKDQSLVLYFGHGSGAQFIRSKSVQRLYPGGHSEHAQKPGCATTLLFGCSSVHLTENGIYEPSGMLMSYMTAGAPAVVGMLWDVTDKDCDRFAVKAGELWGLWRELEGKDEPKTAKKLKGKGKVAQLVEEVENARGTGSGRRLKKGQHEPGDISGQAKGTKNWQRGVGLDEAIREARDACVLRYLNGAAAVVYGIPVYLE
ncbi:hypothetical protein CC78DRAFT_610875 [Lojkania enalia]|uniref:separase n=1 Tax=Lojkania enalia TaxID=147567 RepID=A0A9P4NCY9_9PLEO|nr:hypothetical protein CC78DRAFT_610875 [Didymosphaeria enalia]